MVEAIKRIFREGDRP